MTSRNKELRTLLSQLREESMFLRNQLLAHGNCDCSMVVCHLLSNVYTQTPLFNLFTSKPISVDRLRN